MRDAPAPMGLPPPFDRDDGIGATPPARMRWGEWIAIGLLALAALGWIGLVGIAAYAARPLGIGDVVRGAGVATGPLALIATLLILWQRNASREATRFADVTRGVRTETLALDAVLRLASSRLGEDRAAVAATAERLLAQADTASAKLSDTTAVLSREIAELGRKSAELDAATGTARVDMGVLLADLPIAEGQVRGLADALHTVGRGASERANGLEAALAALTLRAREAEDASGGAAGRFLAQISRIGTTGEIAGRDIDAATTRMNDAVDHVLARAAEAIERTHAGVIAQSEAIDAMIDRARNATEAATASAATALQARVEVLARDLAALATSFAAQDRVAAALIARLEHGLGAVETRFADLDDTGVTRIERLVQALGALGGHADRSIASLNGGGVAATTLINRTETLRGAIQACLAELDDALPTALQRLEGAVDRSRQAVSASTPAIERLGAVAADAAARLSATGHEIDERQAAVDRTVRQQIGRLSALSGEAGETARTAADRLEAQLDRIADASAAVEQRIATAQADVEENDRDHLAGQVAALIDALNSTAIDIVKLMASERDDPAWEAYLRGDRGVFTRRAVKLLDATEAREIARHYGAAPDFRHQVNRYIHDFEALLRPILATRHGSALAVVLLSSEMGKLYVALAQAIERLRA